MRLFRAPPAEGDCTEDLGSAPAPAQTCCVTSGKSLRLPSHGFLDPNAFGDMGYHFPVPHFPKCKPQKTGIFPTLLHTVVLKDDSIKGCTTLDTGATVSVKYPRSRRWEKRISREVQEVAPT